MAYPLGAITAINQRAAQPGAPPPTSAPFRPSPLKPLPPPPPPAAPVDPMAAILARLNALAASPPTPHVVRYDFGGQTAKARSLAEQAVNPLYTQKLNDYLAQEAIQRNRANEDFTTQNQNLDTALQNALDASNITRGRTTEDVNTKLGNITQTEGNYQTNTGNAFDQARSALLGNVATSGLTASGLGQQQVQGQQNQRNLQEGQQEQDFGNQRAATNLFKSRTFEDLARSDMLTNQGVTSQKQQVKVSLDRALQDLGTQEQQTRDTLEAQRQADLLSNQMGQEKALAGQWLQGLQGRINDRDYTATAQSISGIV